MAFGDQYLVIHWGGALIPLLYINSIKFINFISFGQLDLLIKGVLRSLPLIMIWLNILLWFLIALSSGKLFFFYQRVLLVTPNYVFYLKYTLFSINSIKYYYSSACFYFSFVFDHYIFPFFYFQISG